MSLWDELILPAGTLDQLRRDASAERPTHAWLFTGAAGAPHRRAALIFAAALLCEKPDPADRGCGICKGCVTVLNGSHSDFTHFRTEAVSISIDDARELVMKAQDRPSVGRWRVILMEDTERMPERTSNVLLKAIEEPPPHTIWLLTAPSPTDVLVTIRSRCRPVQLPVPAIADVAAKLAADGVEDALARHAAILAQGDAEVATRLAHDPAALQRRETLPLLITGRRRSRRSARREGTHRTIGDPGHHRRGAHLPQPALAGSATGGRAETACEAHPIGYAAAIDDGDSDGTARCAHPAAKLRVCPHE